ncbi:MAG: NADH-quinone oxidoreductase subunit F [Methanomicrobiales archaeon HGW-Methanomicrobiales-4]|nr:MAG: NADH-quinone oxidoreductase subunit F [Methanomicrobiales archaeon HGW-Methanomicrobiales-4]
MRATMNPQQVIDHFTATFGDKISDTRITERGEGVKKIPQRSVWMRVPREIIVDAVKELTTIDYPHLGVISAVDTGDLIELLYHMQIFFGGKHEEINIIFTVPVPKSDPHVPTITGVIPGAVYTEREKQDMIGVMIDGIPDSRRIFLPADFPQGIFPWRKDETGIPDTMVKELWRVGRPEDRPSPAVKVVEKPEKPAIPTPDSSVADTDKMGEQTAGDKNE